MRYVYFTKTLQKLDIMGLIGFCKEAGLDGVDFTVRPGYPVTPANAAVALPEAAKTLSGEGLTIGLVTAPTSMNDPTSKDAVAIFEACGKAGVPAVKLGYFFYQGRFDDGLKQARTRLTGFARLAERTGVKACYHTHSGAMLGNNCAGLRLLLQDFDPHHVGAFVDTGHTAINGGPLPMELDMVRPWLALLAIKDMAWHKGPGGWRHEVVPAGQGIVQWKDVARGLKESRFNGTISLHGEYEVADLAERRRLAKEEALFLKKHLGG
jgi:sugar phosphate isomerase/epimerase